MKYPVFFSRATAAKAALRNGLRAFECFVPKPHLDKNCWTYEERKFGPGVEFAETLMEQHDFIHHVEITDKAIPILVVTCFEHEIDEMFPDFVRVEPITPSLWEKPDQAYRERHIPPRFQK